jgi:hypothetical protein
MAAAGPIAPDHKRGTLIPYIDMDVRAVDSRTAG